MKNTLFYIAALFAGTSFSQAPAEDLINAAALQSGAYMFKTPPSYEATNLMAGDIKPYTPEALFDMSPKLWCSKQKSPFPHVFIIELNEPFLIRQLIFNNAGEAGYKGICAKDVKVEFSATSSQSGFEPVGSYQLKENAVNEFAIAPTEARWIRISVLSNHGNPEYTEMAEFEAKGVYKFPEVKPVSINGKWQTNWGWVNFTQDNSSVGGNYEYNNGLIRFGGINRNKVTYHWIENRVNQKGWTLLVLNSEGTRLTGIWCQNNDWSHYGFWIMERRNGVPMEPMTKESPPAPEPVKSEVNHAIVKEMENMLEKEGKVILYGINFKTNSAEITPDSYTVLDQVADLLKSNAKMNMRIEGHTDNVGSDQYNLSLSGQRAASVKRYFVERHMVADNRLTTIGKGEANPIADNVMEAGRNANRRVEIHVAD